MITVASSANRCNVCSLSPSLGNWNEASMNVILSSKGGGPQLRNLASCVSSLRFLTD
jgi:hypothetical protein